MKTSKWVLVFMFIGLISLVTGSSAQQSSSSEDIIHQKLDLSFLSPTITYKFSAGSDEPLKILPLDYVENSLIPMEGEFEGNEIVNLSQPDINHLQFEGNGSYNSDISELYNISYSALFAPASSSWIWSFNFSYSPFVDSLNSYSNKGFRIESIDIYPNTSATASFYAGTWVHDSYGWAWVLNYLNNDFVAKLNEHGNNNYRITDIEYDNRNQRFGGVWIRDYKGWYWVLNYDFNSFVLKLQEQQNAGRRPIDFQIYLNNNRSGFLYAGVWVANTEGYGYYWALNQTYTDFVTILNQQYTQNRRIIDYEVIQTSVGPRYSAIWVGDGEAGGYAIDFSDVSSFVSKINEFKNNNNIRPMSFEMFNDFLWLGVEDRGPSIIKTYDLAQNYPNPFNPMTTIKFEIPEDAYVTVKIYNLLGVEVATLVTEELLIGKYEIKFNAEELPSGIYFYRMEARGNTTVTLTKKMSLLK